MEKKPWASSLRRGSDAVPVSLLKLSSANMSPGLLQPRPSMVTDVPTGPEVGLTRIWFSLTGGNEVGAELEVELGAGVGLGSLAGVTDVDVVEETTLVASFSAALPEVARGVLLHEQRITAGNARPATTLMDCFTSAFQTSL